MSDFADLKALIARPRLDLRLCLRADLFTQQKRIAEELMRESSGQEDSLAGSPRAHVLREQLAAITEQMENATHTFTFEALPRAAFADLQTAFPSEADGSATPAFLTALVAATLKEPELTADQVGELFADLSDGQVSALENAAWVVNRETGSVDFSENG